MNVKMKLFGYVLMLALPLAILCSSCEEPVDLTADYKDITVSYAFLNVQDDIHYFKVYRGYLTDDNAYVEASKWENIYYPVDSIEVVLEEYNQQKLMRSEKLDTTTQVARDAGYFTNPKQLLYYSKWKLNPEYTYKLVIKNVNTGRTVYAETNIVGEFSVRRPTSNWNMNLDQPYSVQFYDADNAAAYDVYLSFYYIEMDNKTGKIEHKVLTKKLNASLIRAISTAGYITFSKFVPNTFYSFLVQSIPENKNVTRYIDAIDGKPYNCLRLEVWAANEQFLTYQQVASPTSSIVQNRMEYTNFVSEDNSAYGLLASRSSCFKDLKLDNSQGHNEDTLVLGSKTRNLNFDYYRNSPEFLGE